jgi:hypothetical protein
MTDRDQALQPRSTADRPLTRDTRPLSPTARSLTSLQRMAGNRAVVRILARDDLDKTTLRPPKPLTVGAVGGGRSISFQTKTAKLGDVEVYFKGTATVDGAASLEGETIPEDKDLPDPSIKDHDARVRRWEESRVRDQLAAALNLVRPSGDGQQVTFDVFGRPLKLGLARGIVGMPEFVVTGEFPPSKAADIAAGTVKIPKATVSLNATAVIKPGPTHGTATQGSADDSLITANGYTFDGHAAEFDDRAAAEGATRRTGAVALWKAVQDIDDLRPEVKNRWALSSTEKRIAFLVHMRTYFATDAETIEHFKKLRRVQLHTKGKDTNLIMHEEAAVRLEAIRDELPEGSMPATEGGWPRGDVSLHTQATIANLHDLGLAVDFNAYETPNVEDQNLRDLILFVTHGPVWQEGPSTQGKYADMITHVEQRRPMADPDPKSDLGRKLEKVGTEAQAAADRSEAFRASVDVKALLDLRAKRRKDKAAWSKEDDEAMARVVTPWTKAVDDELAADQKTLDASGLDQTTLKHGQALAADWKAVAAAAARAAEFRAKIKGDHLTADQRKTADALIAKLSGFVGAPTAPAAPPSTDTERLQAIEELIAAAKRRTGAYDAIDRSDRAKRLRSKLGDAGWVLGDKDWAKNKKRWELQVKDPSPAQLADLGFFTLRDHSHSAPGGKPQEGAFDIAFVKAMVKHGFNPLAYNPGAGGTDSMHFELRWHGSAMKW